MDRKFALAFQEKAIYKKHKCNAKLKDKKMKAVELFSLLNYLYYIFGLYRCVYIYIYNTCTCDRIHKKYM